MQFDAPFVETRPGKRNTPEAPVGGPHVEILTRHINELTLLRRVDCRYRDRGAMSFDLRNCAVYQARLACAPGFTHMRDLRRAILSDNRENHKQPMTSQTIALAQIKVEPVGTSSFLKETGPLCPEPPRFRAN